VTAGIGEAANGGGGSLFFCAGNLDKSGPFVEAVVATDLPNQTNRWRGEAHTEAQRHRGESRVLAGLVGGMLDADAPEEAGSQNQ